MTLLPEDIMTIANIKRNLRAVTKDLSTAKGKRKQGLMKTRDVLQVLLKREIELEDMRRCKWHDDLITVA